MEEAKQESKPRPFEFEPRPSQVARTVERIRKLVAVPGLAEFFTFKVDEDIPPIAAVNFVGASGSFTYAGVCSHCGKKVALGKVRPEVVIARRGMAPVAFQFGERFCSAKCADAFTTAFIKYGLPMQGLDKPPEKVFIFFEVAGQNYRQN